MIKKISIIGLVTILLISGCSFTKKNDEEATKIVREKKEKVERYVKKEVEIFDLSKEKSAITIEKTGTIEAKNTIRITPEINGVIEKIYFEIGDYVKKDELLVKLGESFNTETLELQAENAEKTLNNAIKTKSLSSQISNESISSANINADSAKEGYQNSLSSKKNTIEALDEQRNGLKIGLKSAYQAQDQAEEALRDAEEAIEDAEDAYYKYKKTPEAEESTKQSLKAQIDLSKNQLELAENSLRNTKNSIEQAENSIDQLDKNYESQIDLLNFSIETSLNQLLAAQNQEDTAILSKEQQLISIDNQINQADLAEKTAKLSLERVNIESPISGTISAIDLNEDDSVNPGETILTIENSNTRKITISLNEQEREEINKKTKIDIIYKEEILNGKITKLSESLDSQSRKYELEITIFESNIPSGSLVKIQLTPEKTEKIYIPLNSVFLIDGEKNVRVIDENNKVDYQEIKTGNIIDGSIEVTSGLQGYEKIVKNQNQFLEEKEIVITK